MNLKDKTVSELYAHKKALADFIEESVLRDHAGEDKDIQEQLLEENGGKIVWIRVEDFDYNTFRLVVNSHLSIAWDVMYKILNSFNEMGLSYFGEVGCEKLDKNNGIRVYKYEISFLTNPDE